MTLQLIDAPRCPYCARVRIMLAEKGIDYEGTVIDLRDRPSWVYELNATGRVPILVDDGWALPESAVINELLEESHPDPALLPGDLAERAEARIRIFRFDSFSDPYYAFRRGELGADEAFAAALTDLDATLAAIPFLTGLAFGLADIAYVPWVIRAREMLGVDLSPYEHLSAWLETLSERPSIAAEIGVVASLV